MIGVCGTCASQMHRNKRVTFQALLVLSVCLGSIVVAARSFAQQKKLGAYQRDVAHVMLRNILNDVKNHYYDPTFHHVDLDARFRQADQKIDEATSFNQVFVLISWALDSLNDSHTYFVPPPRPSRLEYGWQMQLVGSRCLVTAVKPGTDAERKGLKPGDEILVVDGYSVTRDTLPGLQRLFSALLPQTSLTVSLQDTNGLRKNINVQAEVQDRVRDINVWGENVRDLPEMSYAWAVAHRSRDKLIGGDLMIWKMSVFLSEDDLSKEFDKANKFKTLILDLRGNSGGRLDVLTRMVSGLFDHDVRIGERKARKGTSDWVAKTRGSRAFPGKLIVLIDSETASAAEVLARVVQLEKRGTIIGDRTAGMVRAARFFSYRSSPDNAQIVLYGAGITDSDLIMSDGNPLEHVGVTPDELLLPTPGDLAAKRDPVLARAAEFTGAALTPEDAGKLFPVIWETVAKD
jgi:C-terminal processing protease CtpA/Prc